MKSFFRRLPFFERIMKHTRSAMWSEWLVPAGSLIALVIACRDDDFLDGRKVAILFSGEYYRLFILLSVALLAFFAWRKRNPRLILDCALLTVSSLVITNILKYCVPLGRPPHMFHGHALVGYSPGFPSAHTAFVFGLAWLLTSRLPRLALLWFGFAVAVGWSRVELQSHYPYQVLAGALLGLILAWWISEKQRNLFLHLPFYQKKPKSSTLNFFAVRLQSRIW